jgi:hypothetical protein
MFLKRILLLHFFIVCFFSLAQETNIILPNLIDSVNLKSVNFSNGDPLYIINQKENTDYEMLWQKNINKPEVLITQSGEFIYNYKSVIDKRNLCSNTKKIITIESLKNNLLVEINIPKNEYLNFSPSCTEAASYGIARDNFLLTGDLPFYFREWSHELQKMDSSLNIRLFDFKDKDTIPVPLYSGGPTRCAYASYNDYFKSHQLSSKVLLSPNYNKFKSQLTDYLAFNVKLNSNSTIQIYWQFENEKIEVNVFANDLSYNEKNNISLLLRNNIPFPLYDGLYLNTKDTLKIKVSDNKNSIEKGRFSDIYDKYASSEFKNYIRFSQLEQNVFKCLNIKSKAKFISSKNNFTFDNEMINAKTSLYKVRCPGPINSIYALIPGLGIRQFKGLNINLEKRSKFLLRTSLTFATISIASKLISDHFYRQYLNNLSDSFSKNNYNTANSANKIYLSSAAVFASLFIVDFTWTFSLGLKSKKLQHETNREIKNLHIKDVWL